MYSFLKHQLSSWIVNLFFLALSLHCRTLLTLPLTLMNKRWCRLHKRNTYTHTIKVQMPHHGLMYPLVVQPDQMHCPVNSLGQKGLILVSHGQMGLRGPAVLTDRTVTARMIMYTIDVLQLEIMHPVVVSDR